jgi:predicted O-methyltransferase YrrM
MTYRWPKPEGIPTALTLPELELLQDYAHDAKTVLEIGTHLGYSCIGMALAGAHVTSVDPHFEGPADHPDTWEPFLANVARHNVAEQVEPYRKAVEEWDKSQEGRYVQKGNAWNGTYWLPRRWDLVFIDGNHTWPCPWRDTQIALAHLTEPGYIAYHDVTVRWPGVWRATRELELSGRVLKLRQVGTLAVYQKYDSSLSGTSITPATQL